MRPLLCVILANLFCMTAQADWIDEFSGGLPQQAWTFGSVPDGSGYSPPSYSAANNGYMELRSDLAVGSGGAASVAALVAGETFSSNVTVRASLNPNGVILSQDIGVLANFDIATRTGYSFTLNYDNGILDISRVLPQGFPQTLITRSIGTGFSQTASYDLQLSISNGSLVGEAFDSAGSLLATLNATDFNHSSGVAGVVASRDVSDPTLLGTFGRVSAVPEPSSLLAVLSALGAGALAKWKRRREA